MGEVLTAELRQAVVDRLDYLDELVADGDTASKAALAETEIVRLATAWRQLLERHATTPAANVPVARPDGDIVPARSGKLLFTRSSDRICNGRLNQQG